MPKLYAACFFFLLLVSACKKNYPNKEVNEFNEKDFKFILEVPFQGSLSSDSLVMPIQTEIVGNYLLVADQKSEHHVHIYGLDSLDYRGAFGPTGKGPGEMMLPWAVSHDKQGLYYVYDLEGRKMLAWYPDSLLAGKGPKREFKINEKGLTASFALVEDSIYVTDPVRPQGRFFAYDTLSYGMNPVGEMPALKTTGAPTVLSQANHSLLSYCNKRVVIANYLSPFFEIYDPATRTWNAFVGPENLEPQFIEADREGQRVFSIDNQQTRAGFIDIETTDKYIYLLYSGQLMSETTYASGKKILVFDYHGKPVKKYLLEKPVVAFSVLRDSMVYALNVENIKPEIFYYRVKY